MSTRVEQEEQHSWRNISWHQSQQSQQSQQQRQQLTFGRIASTLQQQSVVSDNVRHIAPNNVIKRSTPILFSTNRGLHLRVAKTPAQMTATNTSRLAYSSGAYNIGFCDLERWSTKANAVSLEDSCSTLQRSQFQQNHSLHGNHFTRFNCR